MTGTVEPAEIHYFQMASFIHHPFKKCCIAGLTENSIWKQFASFFLFNFFSPGCKHVLSRSLGSAEKPHLGVNKLVAAICSALPQAKLETSHSQTPRAGPKSPHGLRVGENTYYLPEIIQEDGRAAWAIWVMLQPRLCKVRMEGEAATCLILVGVLS